MVFGWPGESQEECQTKRLLCPAGSIVSSSRKSRGWAGCWIHGTTAAIHYHHHYNIGNNLITLYITSPPPCHDRYDEKLRKMGLAFIKDVV